MCTDNGPAYCGGLSTFWEWRPYRMHGVSKCKRNCVDVLVSVHEAGPQSCLEVRRLYVIMILVLLDCLLGLFSWIVFLDGLLRLSSWIVVVL